MYNGKLPTTHQIASLSMRVTKYPATRSEVVRTARMWNFDNDVVMFLRQFPTDRLFTSRTELVLKCNELATRVRRQWESPQRPTQLSMI